MAPQETEGEQEAAGEASGESYGGYDSRSDGASPRRILVYDYRKGTAGLEDRAREVRVRAEEYMAKARPAIEGLVRKLRPTKGNRVRPDSAYLEREKAYLSELEHQIAMFPGYCYELYEKDILRLRRRLTWARVRQAVHLGFSHFGGADGGAQRVLKRAKSQASFLQRGWIPVYFWTLRAMSGHNGASGNHEIQEHSSTHYQQRTDCYRRP